MPGFKLPSVPSTAVGVVAGRTACTALPCGTRPTERVGWAACIDTQAPPLSVLWGVSRCVDAVGDAVPDSERRGDGALHAARA